MPTIYVDNTLGADITNGSYSIANRDNSGSDGDAYEYAQDAADATAAGDTVMFRVGTHVSASALSRIPVMHVSIDGTAGNVITYQNYNGEAVIISGKYSGSNYRYQAVILGTKPDGSDNSGAGVEYITLSGLTFIGATYEGLCICGESNRVGAVTDPGTNITVTHCVATDNGPNASSMGIRSCGRVENVLIEYCEAYDNTGTGIMLDYVGLGWHTSEDEDEMSAAHSSSIENCIAYDNLKVDQEGNSDGIGMGCAYQCTVEGNIAFRNGDDGFDVNESIEVAITDNIAFNNGVGADGNMWGFKYSNGGGGRHVISGNVAADHGVATVKGGGFEGSQPSSVRRTLYASKLFNNTSCNNRWNFATSTGYDNYAGWTKIYFRNNIACEDYDNKGITFFTGFIDSDYNYIYSSASLALLVTEGCDGNSLTGTHGVVDEDYAITTDFSGLTTIEQKLAYIRDQATANFSLAVGSPLIDTGVVVNGFHNAAAGAGALRDWYDDDPDIGAYESTDGGTPPVASSGEYLSVTASNYVKYIKT